MAGHRSTKYQSKKETMAPQKSVTERIATEAPEQVRIDYARATAEHGAFEMQLSKLTPERAHQLRIAKHAATFSNCMLAGITPTAARIGLAKLMALMVDAYGEEFITEQVDYDIEAQKLFDEMKG